MSAIESLGELGAEQSEEWPADVTEDADIIPFPLAPGKEFNLAVVKWMQTAEYPFFEKFKKRF